MGLLKQGYAAAQVLRGITKRAAVLRHGKREARGASRSDTLELGTPEDETFELGDLGYLGSESAYLGVSYHNWQIYGSFVWAEKTAAKVDEDSGVSRRKKAVCCTSMYFGVPYCESTVMRSTEGDGRRSRATGAPVWMQQACSALDH